MIILLSCKKYHSFSETLKHVKTTDCLLKIHILKILFVQSASLKQYFFENTFKVRSCRMTVYSGILLENYLHCYSHIHFSEEM